MKEEMCSTTDSSFQSSNILNNTGVWSLIELASLYTVPLSAVNGLSCLTTTSNGQARTIRKFSTPNQPITFEMNLIKLGRPTVSALQVMPVPKRILGNYLLRWLGSVVVRASDSWPWTDGLVVGRVTVSVCGRVNHLDT